MRHVLLPCAIAAGTRGMVRAPAAARLIAPAGRPLGVVSRLSCTAVRSARVFHSGVSPSGVFSRAQGTSTLTWPNVPSSGRDQWPWR
jgi:hypothetical protein